MGGNSWCGTAKTLNTALGAPLVHPGTSGDLTSKLRARWFVPAKLIKENRKVKGVQLTMSTQKVFTMKRSDA